MATCKYSDVEFTCKRPANEPHDNEHCIFHAPKDKKGISGKEFNHLISEQIEKKDCNFRGYIFPESIDFYILTKGKVFDKQVDFSFAKFEGEASDFCASFECVIFKERALFLEVQFNGDANFGNVQFNGDADFKKAKFSGNALFAITQFNGLTDFIRAQFNGDAIFLGTLFSGNANFGGTLFSGNALFKDFAIINTMTFIDTQFSNNTKFVLENPHFVFDKNKNAEPSAKIRFERIIFIPQLTYFENIQTDSYDIKTHLPFGLILFRYCNLTEVYFTKCNLSMISFYKSQFNAALFYSNSWDESRKNVICDELLYKYVRSQEDGGRLIGFRETYGIEDLDSYREIASLYCSFKNALDSIKNYSESGWFYFNEFEMKRRALWDEYKDKGKKWYSKLRELGYFILYSLYKVFMGYGEKPAWSFGWLLLSFTIFLITYLFVGLKINNAEMINYDLACKTPDFVSLISDMGISAIFFITRILPINYIPKQWQDITYEGWALIPFLNTLILIIFGVFIGVGLKRHFRRY